MDTNQTLDTLIAANILTLRYAKVFLHICRCNRTVVNQKEIAKSLATTQVSVSRAMSHLSLAGLITRERWNEDKKFLEISVTSKGKDLVRKLAL